MIIDTELAARLAQQTRFERLVHLASCASTQDEALAERGNVCIWSDEQTSGRGRRGRVWDGAAGQDVEFTLRVQGFAPPRPELVAPTVPAAVLVALESLCGTRLTLKWPNDVLCRGRKLSGILIDVLGGAEPVWLIGIGINVNRQRFPDELRESAMSLALVGGQPLDRAEVVVRVASAIERALASLEHGHFDALEEVFRDRSDLIGRRVRLDAAGAETAEGIVSALDLASIQLEGAAPVPLARVEAVCRA